MSCSLPRMRPVPTNVQCSFCRRAASTATPLPRRPNAPKPATKRRLPTRQLIYPFILSSAVASLAINLKNAREEYRLLESRHAAQMSVLDETITKLQKGIRISDADLKRDYERVGLLQREVYVKAERIGWREMLLGKKKSETDLAAERQEMKDLEEALSRAEHGLPQKSVANDTESIPNQLRAAASAAVAAPASTPSVGQLQIEMSADQQQTAGKHILV